MHVARSTCAHRQDALESLSLLSSMRKSSLHHTWATPESSTHLGPGKLLTGSATACWVSANWQAWPCARGLATSVGDDERTRAIKLP